MSLSLADQTYWQDVDIYVSLSALVILQYEILITLDDEVIYVWKHGFNKVNVLFVLNRYLAVAAAVTGIAGSFVFYPLLSCRIIYNLCAVFQIGAQLSVGAFNSIRVWAVTGQKWIPSMVVLFIGLLTPCINMYQLYITRWSMIASNCEPSFPTTISVVIGLGTTSRASLVVTDLLVLLAIWIHTFHVWKAAQDAGMKAELASILLCDGTAYFIALLLMHVTSIVLDNINSVESNPAILLSDPMTAILIARLLLNLRKYETAAFNEDISQKDAFIAQALTNTGAIQSIVFAHSRMEDAEQTHLDSNSLHEQNSADSEELMDNV